MDLLKKFFNLKVLGKTKKLLGVKFEETNGKLHIHQSTYNDKICSLYSKYNFSTCSVPMLKSLVLSKMYYPTNHYETDELSKNPYKNLVGCLSFFAGRTWPDILYAVNILSRFQFNPGYETLEQFS